MAHTKAGGSTRQKGNRRGKHLGVKLYGGQKASSGHIIVRQKGSHFHPGVGVRMGNDFTLYAVREGIISFVKKQGRQFVSIFDR